MKRWEIYAPRPENGLWVFTDKSYELILGDKIEYLIHVVRNSLQLRINGNWTVSGKKQRFVTNVLIKPRILFHRFHDIHRNI